ncbi:MAG: DUF6263 family protein [Pirellulaceae bacterium]|nr:DUF6263 family protein [Pirellulaceae bacterium]
MRWLSTVWLLCFLPLFAVKTSFWVCHPAYADAGELVCWKLTKGQRFDVTMNQEMEQITVILGNEVKVPQTTRMEMAWTINEVDEQGNFRITQEIKRLKVATQLPDQGELIYDSNEADPPAGLATQLSTIMGPMINARIEQTMSPQGEVWDVKFPNAALAGLQQAPILKRMLSDEMMKKSFALSSPEFPKEALAKGQMWQTNAETKSPLGVMKVTNSYTYGGTVQRAGKNFELMGVTVNTVFGADGNTLGTKVEVKDQVSEGQILFDNENGYLVESKVKTNMTMLITAFGQSMDQKTEATQTLTFTPVEQESLK